MWAINVTVSCGLVLSWMFARVGAGRAWRMLTRRRSAVHRPELGEHLGREELEIAGQGFDTAGRA